MQIQHTKRCRFITCLIFLSDNWEEDKQTWSGPQWRRCCGCGSSGRRLANTPWRSTHGHWSGSSRAGWPGRGVERHWSSRRSSSHSWGCSVNKTTVRLTEVQWPRFHLPICRSSQHVPVHLITGHNVFFLQGLDSVQFSSFLKFCQQYLDGNTHNQPNEENHERRLRWIALSSREMLPSQSVLGPELRYTCNRPFASLWNTNKNQNTKVRKGFILLQQILEGVHLSSCVL